jgi:hypothetical protein
MYNIEEELEERLIEAGREPIGSGLATALVEDSFEELDRVLRDLVDPEPIKGKIESYFDSFATADFFQELHELSSTLKIRENFETYLCVGELQFNRASYPLFYLSLNVELEDRIFRITADPHLYINKKAVDFAAQEIARETGTPNLVRIDERIVYLEPGQDFAGIMQRLLARWTADLALPPLARNNAGSSRSRGRLAAARVTRLLRSFSRRSLRARTCWCCPTRRKLWTSSRTS